MLRTTFSCLYILLHCSEWIHSLYPFCVCVLRSLQRSSRTPFLAYIWSTIPPCCSRTASVIVRFLRTEVVLRFGFVPKQKRLLLKRQNENQGSCPIKLAAQKNASGLVAFSTAWLISSSFRLNSLQTRYSIMEIFQNNPVVIYQATYFFIWRGRRLTFSEHVNKMRSCLLQQRENYVPCQFLNIELPGCIRFLECNFISIFMCLKDTKVTLWKCTKRIATPARTCTRARDTNASSKTVWCVFHKSWTTIINHILIFGNK